MKILVSLARRFDLHSCMLEGPIASWCSPARCMFQRLSQKLWYILPLFLHIYFRVPCIHSPNKFYFSFHLASFHISHWPSSKMERMRELRAPQDQKNDDVSMSEGEIKGAISDVEPQDTYDGDEDRLARLGKKQVLKVHDQCPMFTHLPR